MENNKRPAEGRGFIVWQAEIFLAVAGICGGAVAAFALGAFTIGLGIIPRYAGITHTGDHILLYEDSIILGTIIGNLLSIYEPFLPFGSQGLAVTGVFFGIFLGSWIIALGEVVNVFAIIARRIGITRGVGLIVLCIAAGKILGSLMQFFA